MTVLGKTLVYLRKRANLSQQELADKLELTRSAIGMYETGRREPDLETLEIFADFYNVDMNTLTGHTDIDKLVKEFHLDELDREIITAYLELPEAERKAVKSLIQNMVQRTQKDDVATRTIEKEARAEAERYYQELVREKRQESQALFANESDAG